MYVCTGRRCTHAHLLWQFPRPMCMRTWTNQKLVAPDNQPMGKGQSPLPPDTWHGRSFSSVGVVVINYVSSPQRRGLAMTESFFRKSAHYQVYMTLVDRFSAAQHFAARRCPARCSSTRAREHKLPNLRPSAHRNASGYLLSAFSSSSGFDLGAKYRAILPEPHAIISKQWAPPRTSSN